MTAAEIAALESLGRELAEYMRPVCEVGQKVCGGERATRRESR